MESNEVLDRLPNHLRSLIIDQPYADYTPRDHAVWRYVLRQNTRFLPGVAHPSYLSGLERTGISIDRIPNMYGMNRILSEIGWAAVAVDGFIPPAAFMEFQAYNVLVIAADIRSADQILYTPAPDIIHEAAGHAPIIADPEYAAYLREFGQVGTRAFSSALDYRIYEAIRHLSILKADPYTSPSAIEEAEQNLSHLSSIQESPSEMALLRNLHWWTVEYGLIGTIANPKIYGAGLLSSIGESYSCLQPSVKKIPYTLDAMNYGFDITTRQPQLFVTPDFAQLSRVLREYLKTMAVTTGGVAGLRKALGSGSVGTAEYSSGLQVSGILNEIIESGGEPAYLSFAGPVMLSDRDKQIPGHGTDTHRQGFGSSAGKLAGVGTDTENLTDSELARLGIEYDKEVNLIFESGVKVNGILRSIHRSQGKNQIFSFSDCTVVVQDRFLFRPDWGMYDMAVGSRIVSVYSGPADPDSYGLYYTAPSEKTHHIRYTPEMIRLHELYEKVSTIRKNRKSYPELNDIWIELQRDFPEEWLLMLEMAEDMTDIPGLESVRAEVLNRLSLLSAQNEELKKLIPDGLSLIKNH
jgi:phenylalanine-4-hydroxylase